ncbi:MAG: DUF3987 domain-containing protein [Pseudomonadota bacterium]
MNAHEPNGLAAALRLAEAGIPVFPCDGHPKPADAARYPGEPGKGPLTPRGFYDATTDPEQLQKWWTRWPDALPAVPMGPTSGLFAVDCDLCDETGETLGEASLEGLGITAARHPYFMPSNSGGGHLFYRWREGLPGNSTKKLPGVDIRSQGGYVIAWRADILAAAAQDPDLAEPPAALLGALAEAKRDKAAEGSERLRDFNSAPSGGDLASAWAEAALADEIAKLRSTAKGGRNNAVNATAFSLGQIVAGGHLDRERVEAEIWAAAQVNGVAKEEPRETRASIASGLNAGMVDPRGPKDAPPARTSCEAAEWPTPDMSLLRPERGVAPELSLEAVFGPIWAHWIAAAADAKGAPPDYVAAALIATAGSLIGNARWVSPWRGWSEPPILWAMLIGAPSAGKSPALDAALAPLRTLEKNVRRAAEIERVAWAERAETADLALAAWKADATKALKANEEPPTKPDAADAGPEPHVPRLSVNDATVERLSVILERQPRGVLAMRDELAGWLSNMSRYANGGSDKPFWLEAYGGRPFTVERMSREPVRIDRLTVGVLGGIQPDRLASLLIRADDDGTLARLLPIWPDPAPIKRPHSAPDDAFAEEAFARLYELAMPTDEAGDPRPWFVPFAESARDILDQFRRWAREEETGESGLLVSFIGKTPGMAVRLALVLAHLDWTTRPDMRPPEEVTADHFGRAAHYVSEYAVPMARRAYAEASAPAEERAAQRLARLIVEQRWDAFTMRDVTRRERQGLRRNADVEPALDVLTQGGWLRSQQPASGPKGGRPQRVFHVNPAVRGRS